MSSFQVRKATPKDARTIAEQIVAMTIELETMGGYQSAEQCTSVAKLTRRVRARLTNEEHFYLVAEDSSGVVGLIEASRVHLPVVFLDRRVAHIYALYVKPVSRRQGIAHLLITHAIEWCSQMGLDDIELDVLAKNPAELLYARMGFTVFQHQMNLHISSR